MKRVLAQSDRFLLGTLLLGLVLRLAYWRFSAEWTSVEGALRWPDERLYFTLSRAILDQGVEYFASDERVMWVTSGNPLYLGLLGSVLLIKAVNVFASTATIALVYGVARRMADRVAVARLAALLTATSPLLIEYAPTVLTEPPFTFLLVAWWYATLRALEPGRANRWMLAGGVLLGLSCLFRPTPQMLPLGLVALVPIWSRIVSGTWRPLLARVVVVQAAIVFAVGAPFMIRNASAGHGFSMANGFGTAMFLGARQDTRGDEPPLVHKTYDNEKVCPGIHLSTQCDRMLMAHATASIREQPGAYLSLIPAKAFRMWIGNSFAHFFPARGLISGLRTLPLRDILWSLLRLLHASCIVVFAVIAVLWPGSLRSAAGFLTFLVVGYFTAVHALSFANPRYGYPLVPFMAAFAAQGLAASRLIPNASADHSPASAAVRRVGVLAVAVLMFSVLFGWEAP